MLNISEKYITFAQRNKKRKTMKTATLKLSNRPTTWVPQDGTITIEKNVITGIEGKVFQLWKPKQT